MALPLAAIALGAAVLKNREDADNRRRDEMVNAVKEANSTYKDPNLVNVRQTNPWGNLAQFGMAGMLADQEGDAFKSDEALKKAQTGFVTNKANDPFYQSGRPPSWSYLKSQYPAPAAPGFIYDQDSYAPKTYKSRWLGTVGE